MNVWLSLIRPKTLVASATPVIISVGYAALNGYFDFDIAFLCLSFALMAQISSNIANDYLDFIKGHDTGERLGPERVLAKGLLSQNKVKWAFMSSLLITCIIGLGIALLVSWWLILVGLIIIPTIYLYSGGKYPLSALGLGDIAVILFFGIIPLVFTYYTISHRFSIDVFVLGLSSGLVNDTILIVNNYRDYEEDKGSGKKTIFVRYGKELAPRLYMASWLTSMLLLYPLMNKYSIVLMLPCFMIFKRNQAQTFRVEGRELNKYLGRAAMGVMAYLLTVCLMMLTFI